MDSRSKILSPAAAAALPAPVTLAIGTFDVVRAEHARELAAIRNAAGLLLVAVLSHENALLFQQARAELVAALRMVDYVVAPAPNEIDLLISALRPARIVRMEVGDAQRTKQLIEHVHRRQTA